MPLDKYTARKLYKQKRMNLTSDEYTALNTKLIRQLQVLPYGQLAYLHLFLPIAKFMEPDLFPFISWLRIEHPHLRLVIPKVMDDCSLEHHLLLDGTSLTTNHWGIPELATEHLGDAVPVSLIDMVLVPLLAFDSLGHRLGYGKGFYDRFLASCRKDTLKVGVSLFPVMDELLLVGDHDVPMDAVVCPEKIYRF
ncbi:5-formyltetrahydrofolate cyclo-ligase [Olivibacter sitiensis]|uniref:5-formyltetrahydrofolate cyclo-ligase n=1 Tax=Olivibacter sitiensis TaxID=376470 RepID=UPI00056940DF|nr:5-formyltetrahydrofolate cyclo-ligase [Olivibacter sitiensis]